MTNEDKASEARKGLLDSVKGKVKEAAGALTKNESLIAEGQLQQSEAAARREANSQRAIADAESKDAARALQQERAAADAQRRQANDEIAAREQVAEAQRRGAHATAEQDAARSAPRRWRQRRSAPTLTSSRSGPKATPRSVPP